MKTRESGMPDEQRWANFFSPAQTLTRLGLTPSCHDVVDVSCGYGTFSIPVARMVRSTVHALDIEVEMVATASHKAVELGLTNVRVERRDFVAEGTELPDVTYRCRPASSTNRRPSVTIQVITAKTFDPAGAWRCLGGERF